MSVDSRHRYSAGASVAHSPAPSPASPRSCRGFVGLFTPPQDVAEAIARQVVIL